MSSIAANGIAMLAARLLPPVFAFAIHVTVARLAGADVLGSYVYLLAVLMIFQSVAGAGMPFLVTRDLAAQPAEPAAYLRRARSFALLSGAGATAGYLGFAALALPRQLALDAAILSLTLLPSAWIAIQESVFIATRTHHRITVVAILENAIKMSVAVAALRSGYGLTTVCVGIAAARAAAAATGSLMVGRAGFTGAWRLDLGAIGPFAAAVLPFAGLFIVSMTYFRIDIPIVQAILGKSATGFYGAAATLYGAALLLPESAMATAYPRLASAFQASRAGYGAATLLLARVLGLALVPVSLALICLSDLIVSVAYGHRFPASAPVLRMLALSLPLHAVNGALGQALQAAHEQRAMLGIVTGGLVLHVLLNIGLVAALGIQGAALALFLSSSGVAVGALWTVHRRIAPVRIGVPDVCRIAAVAAPLAAASLVPDAYRLAAGLAGAAWIAWVGSGAGLLGPADRARIAQALNPARVGAAA